MMDFLLRPTKSESDAFDRSFPSPSILTTNTGTTDFDVLNRPAQQGNGYPVAYSLPYVATGFKCFYAVLITNFTNLFRFSIREIRLFGIHEHLIPHGWDSATRCLQLELPESQSSVANGSCRSFRIQLKKRSSRLEEIEILLCRGIAQCLCWFCQHLIGDGMREIVEHLTFKVPERVLC